MTYMKFIITFILLLTLIFSFSIVAFAENETSEIVTSSDSSDIDSTFSYSYYLHRIYILLFILVAFTISGIFISRPRRF